MNGLHERSVGPSSRYTVLANNVSIVLSAMDMERIGDAEQRLMDRAADLLRNIVQGSKFVERKDAHALANPSETLFTVGHAISALQSLDKSDVHAKHVTKTFEEFEQDLRSLSKGESITASRMAAIAKFFDALGSLFYRDIADTAVIQRQPLFEKRTE